MIECLTYRMGPHSTSDDPNRYRTRNETEFWKKRDPIERFRWYLEQRGIWNQDYETKMRSEVEQEINSAIEAEEQIPPPKMSSMFEGVFEEEPRLLKEQEMDALSFSSEGD